MAAGEGNLLERLRQAPPWVWISILLGAGVLVVTWLIYKRSQQPQDLNSVLSSGVVPYGGAGQPDWASALSGDAFTSGFTTTDWQNLVNYILSQQTPNPPPAATPDPTPVTSSKYYQAGNGETLAEIASKFGLKLSDLYYNGNNATIQAYLRQHGGIKNANTTVLPAGTTVYLAGTPSPAFRGSNPSDPVGTLG